MWPSDPCSHMYVKGCQSQPCCQTISGRTESTSVEPRAELLRDEDDEVHDQQLLDHVRGDRRTESHPGLAVAASVHADVSPRACSVAPDAAPHPHERGGCVMSIPVNAPADSGPAGRARGLPRSSYSLRSPAGGVNASLLRGRAPRGCAGWPRRRARRDRARARSSRRRAASSPRRARHWDAVPSTIAPASSSSRIEWNQGFRRRYSLHDAAASGASPTRAKIHIERSIWRGSRPRRRQCSASTPLGLPPRAPAAEAGSRPRRRRGARPARACAGPWRRSRSGSGPPAESGARARGRARRSGRAASRSRPAREPRSAVSVSSSRAIRSAGAANGRPKRASIGWSPAETRKRRRPGARRTAVATACASRAAFQ